MAAYPALIDALAQRGWSEAELAKLGWRNVHRALAEAEMVSAELRDRCGPSLARSSSWTGPSTASGPASPRRTARVSGLLEVLALHPADAERAEAGGADRVSLVGSTEHDGLSPEPALVGQVRRATSLPIRVLLRLREGYGTDGGEVARLRGLVSSYRSVGADGMVLGFLNAHTEVDAEVVAEIVGNEPDFGWTFSRAVDACISSDRAWRTLRGFPGLDQVLTAGSARGVSEGLDDLLARAGSNPYARQVIMAGGGLLPEHVPWLARAGDRRLPPRRARCARSSPTRPTWMRIWSAPGAA